MLTPPKRRYHPVQTLDDQGPIPLTPQTHARMKARLMRLKKQLPSFIEDAALAAADGDRSDNAAYQAAKAALRRTQRQIFTLEDQLKRVVLIADPAARSKTGGTVRLGSTVILETLEEYGSTKKEKGKKVTFRILGPFETDPAAGKISYKSPLGAALMGKRKGDEVGIAAGTGVRKYRVLGVK